MDKEVKDYIESTLLGYLNWREDIPSEDSSIDYGFVFMIISCGDQYALDIGRLSGVFVSMDDLSYCGPVRNVAAWAPIKNPEPMLEDR